MTRNEYVMKYIDLWLDRYPFNSQTVDADANRACRHSEKLWVEQLSLGDLTPGKVERLIWWKFKRVSYRRRALAAIQPDRRDATIEHVEHAIAAANADGSDDWSPVSELLKVDGWGPAMASAILAVRYPDRFTIADWRALASVRKIGHLAGGTNGRAFPASKELWLSYLGACRGLRDLTGHTLREVDQALWAAKGSLNPPYAWVTDPESFPAGKLMLRTVEVDDASVLTAISQDPAVLQALDKSSFPTIEGVTLALWAQRAGWGVLPRFMFTVTLGEEVIGYAEVTNIGPVAAELTVVLDADHRGHGHGKAVLSALIEWSFRCCPMVPELLGSCITSNEGSIALMRSVGMEDCGAVTSNEGEQVRKFRVRRH
jgi:RimJ/RimL family protein N-acetyltransferase